MLDHMTQSLVDDVFLKMNIRSEIAQLYKTLLERGAQNISELAANSGIERTQVYRLLEEMQSLNLIEIEKQYKRNILHAAPIDNLFILLNKEKEDLQITEQNLHSIKNTLMKQMADNTNTKVNFYRGAEGIRQMQWNLLRAKSEVLSIIAEGVNHITGVEFFKSWVEEWNASDKKLRLLVSENARDRHDTHWEDLGLPLVKQEERMLPNSILKVDFSSDIYDDVVSFYDWTGGEIFGIEIHNQHIANAQRDFFERLWAEAK